MLVNASRERPIIFMIKTLPARNRSRAARRSLNRTALFAKHFASVKNPASYPTLRACDAVARLLYAVAAQTALLRIDQGQDGVVRCLQHFGKIKDKPERVKKKKAARFPSSSLDPTFVPLNLIFFEESLFQKLLALQAVSCPGYGFETLRIDIFFAILAGAVLIVIDSQQCFVDQAELLAVVL